MPHEDCNKLIVKSMSNNDDVALSLQQCNVINIPPPLPMAHEDYNEITEN